MIRMLNSLARFGREVDVLFVCTASVDEIWIRSTALECASRGMRVGLAVCDQDMKIHRHFDKLYGGQGIRLFLALSLRRVAKIRCAAMITASSGLTRDIFPTDSSVFVHMPHSLASLHMVYPETAFDGYDYLFAAGPHHVAEFAAITCRNGLKNKGAVPVGYGKMDAFRNVAPRNSEERHVLVAPSWGSKNLLESFGHALIVELLKSGWKVTVRPHPLFFLEKSTQITQLVDLARTHEGVTLESSLDGDQAIHSAGLMIGDYSGTSFEFSAFRRKPVISVNVAPKVVNQNWKELGIVPVEIGARHLLGPVVDPDIDQILEILKSSPQGIDENSVKEFLFDDGGSCARRATDKLMELIG